MPKEIIETYPEPKEEDLDMEDEHQMIELEEDPMKDLSNPASQDYVIEKLKDMENNNRLTK